MFVCLNSQKIDDRTKVENQKNVFSNFVSRNFYVCRNKKLQKWGGGDIDGSEKGQYGTFSLSKIDHAIFIFQGISDRLFSCFFRRRKCFNKTKILLSCRRHFSVFWG